MVDAKRKATVVTWQGFALAAGVLTVVVATTACGTATGGAMAPGSASLAPPLSHTAVPFYGWVGPGGGSGVEDPRR
jgi:hypothetical protein